MGREYFHNGQKKELLGYLCLVNAEGTRMNLSRRQILGWGSTISAGAAFGFHQLATARRNSTESSPLVADPRGLLDLPSGFRYRVLASTGDKMSDGARRRELPDGMACAPLGPDRLALLLNHEMDANGGVSRLVLDRKTLEVVSSNDVLSRTERNCAGGPSPWGWLSCEEVSRGGVWLCPWDTASVQEGDQRRRLNDYGTFRHEAVCIDPESYVAYLTEDDGPSHIFRMVPHDKGAPFRGQLQALAALGPKRADTAEMKPGEQFELKWIQVDPAQARASAQDKDATVFHRTEGIWFFDGEIYFTATSNDQLFRIKPRGEGGTVELVTTDLKSPDNITVAPWGDVIVAEDRKGHCRLRLVKPTGTVTTLARNAYKSGHELAGVCFSPDGSTLFCNLQKSGQTVAITGPFQQI